MNSMSYIPIVLPLIVGFASTIVCPMSKDSGSVVKIRPNPGVFSIAWSILYLLVGISWYMSRNSVTSMRSKSLVDTFYVLLNIVFFLWVYVYSCKNNKKLSVYVIITALTASLWCYTVASDVGKMLIVPLIGWLVLATFLNVLEVEKKE